MRRCRIHSWLVTALLAAMAAGCSVKPQELRQRAVQAEIAARQAFEDRQPEAAEQAASRAEDAASQLQEQAQSGRFPVDEMIVFLREARVAAASARTYAQLADEERQCRERLASLKLKAYRSARAALCNYGFGGLAPAAEHFARADTNSLSVAEQQAAWLAWSVVKFVRDPVPMTNGAPDWNNVAAELRVWSKDPPPGMGMFLAAAFALNGLTDFALSELESVESSRLSATNARALYHLERSVLFGAHGWDRTAARELDQALQLAPEGWHGPVTTQAVALIHVWRAGSALQRKDFNTADREIATALKTWPDGPLAALMRGERLAAGGEWKQAADLLEAQVSDTTDEWLARRLAQRARELRATQGTAPSPFADPSFVFEVVTRAVDKSARDLGFYQWLQQFLADARGFGLRVMGKLPQENGGG